MKQILSNFRLNFRKNLKKKKKFQEKFHQVVPRGVKIYDVGISKKFAGRRNSGVCDLKVSVFNPNETLNFI